MQDPRFHVVVSARGKLVTLVLLGLLFLGTPSAFAACDVVVQLAGPSGETLQAVLTPPDGSSLTGRDEDGDGTVVLHLKSAGGHRLELTAGELRAERTLEVPLNGLVTVTWDPSAAGEEALTVAYETFGNEEIVVTARKREENVQSTPIAITAFSAEMLEERSIQGISDVADFVPNVHFSNTGALGGSGSAATVYIRGLGQDNPNFYADPSVGVYVDGVFLARSQGAAFDLLEPERVEVLRGPQGTLFGKNTNGGAIHLITRRPTSEFAGELEGTFGDLDRLDGKLRIGGSLGEKAFGSLALQTSNRDGFLESLETGERFGDLNRDAGRAALRWLATENVVLDWNVTATREREAGMGLRLLAIRRTPVLELYDAALAGDGFPHFTDDLLLDDWYKNRATRPSFSDADTWTTTMQVSLNLGAVQLTSISAYREIEYAGDGDFDGSPTEISHRPAVLDESQLSQELQWTGVAGDDRLDWLVGLYYFREQIDEWAQGALLVNLFEALEAAPGPIYTIGPDFLCNPGPPPPGVPCWGGAGNPLNFAFYVDPGAYTINDHRTDSYAVFGQTTWRWTDRLNLTTGLRYTYEEKDYDFFDFHTVSPDRLLQAKDHWDSFSPRLSLDLQATPQTLFYVSLARGFTSGGFNGFPQRRDVIDSYGPEFVWSYELGLKTDLAGNRLRLNTALFWNDYQDIQFPASLAIGDEPVFVVKNAGTAEIKGFELELRAQPTRRFGLSASLGYLDSKYTELRDTQPGSVSLDGVMPRSPEWSYSLSLMYEVPFGEDGAVRLHGDYSWQDDYFLNEVNSILQEAYGLLSARIAVAPGKTWEVALFGTNLTGEEYLENALDPGAFGTPLGVSARPREWGLSVRFRY